MKFIKKIVDNFSECPEKDKQQLLTTVNQVQQIVDTINSHPNSDPTIKKNIEQKYFN